MVEEKRNDFLEEKFVSKGIIEHKKTGDEYSYWIVPAPIEDSYNGYIHFKKRPTVETCYSGILTYVPVHGGITYAEEDDDGIVYGFDTSHCDSDKFPRKDIDWIKGQIQIMLEGILVAQKVEKKYLCAKKNQTKAKYAQQVLDVDKGKEQEYSFGVMLNLLCGKV